MKRFLLSILCFVAVAMAGYAQTVQVTVSPAPGEIDEIPQTIKVTTDVDVYFNQHFIPSMAGKITFTDANNTEYAFTTPDLPAYSPNPSGNRVREFSVNLTNGAITTPGTYTLYIKASSLLHDDGLYANGVESFTWTVVEGGGSTTPVVEPIKFTSVTPNEGVVEKIENITVVTDTDITAAPTNWTFTDANGNVHQLNSVMVHPSMKNTLFIDFNPIVFTAAGTYTLNIPAGSLTGSDNKTNNEAKTYTWTIEASTPPAEKEYIVIDQDNDVSPSVGSIVTGSLSSIIIYTYNNNITDINEDLVRIEDANGTTYSFTTEHADYDVNGAYEVTFINLTTPITTIGACTLTMEEGAMVDGSNPNATNAKLEYSWTIAEAPKDYFEITSITPAQGNIDEIPTVIEVITNSTLIYEYDIEKMSLTDGTTNYPISEVELIETDPYVYVGAKLYLDNAITTPGTYTLTLEEGAIIGASFISTHSTNPLTTVEWTIEGSSTEPEVDPIVVTETVPAYGTTVTEIPSTITIKTNTELSNVDASKIIFNDAAVAGATYEGANVTVTLANAVTAAGTYALVLQEGALTGANGATNNEYTYTWTIGDNSTELDPNTVNFLGTNPEEGIVDELPQNIHIICDRDLFFDTSLLALKKVHFTDADGNTIAIKTCVALDNDGNMDNGMETLEVRLYEAITAAGTYTLTFDEGAIKYQKDKSIVNKEKSFTWIIGDKELYEENIHSEQNYFLDLNNVWNAEDGWFAAYFVNKNTNAGTWVRGEYNTKGDGVLFYLSQHNVPTDAARAKAVAPLYTHIVFTQMNNAVDANVHENMNWDNAAKQTDFVTYDGSVVTYDGKEYRIYQLQADGGVWLTGTEVPTGIEGVEADAVDGYVVYDLNGYLVMQTRNAADLQTLEKGFYIINGKKVVLTR